MGIETKIEWCDATLNLWWGCTKVSDGCKFCYAERLADHRHKKGNWGPGGTRKEVKSWRSTLGTISKRARTEKRRLKVFVSSMSDIFEGPETMGGVESENWATVTRLRENLLMAIKENMHMDFLILTKRPENIMKHWPHLQHWKDAAGPTMPWHSNVWFGTSVEDQKTADERIPHLLQVPAAVRFLSCEPLLGPVELDDLVIEDDGDSELHLDCLSNDVQIEDDEDFGGATIHWVIAGGESGPNARPMHPDWAESLRDQCQAAGVPFFFKQWGEYLPWYEFKNSGVNDDYETSKFRVSIWNDDKSEFEDYGFPDGESFDDEVCPMGRVGKKAAGRLLDGREWSEFPKVTK
jgi:protein gp37